MKKIKHSKFKNTGVLFELLIRQITLEVLNGDTQEKAKKILSEHFNQKTEIGKELRLYQLLSQEKYKAENRAEKFIDTILEARKRIDVRKLTKEKYNLIKKIQENFDLSFRFSHFSLTLKKNTQHVRSSTGRVPVTTQNRRQSERCY